MRLVIYFTIFIFVFLNCFLQAQENDFSSLESSQSCELVQKIYSVCGDNVKIDKEANILLVDSGFKKSKYICDDGKKLDFYERMENMDVRSLFLIPYQMGSIPLPEVRKNFDPGRLRLEQLNRTVFGSSESNVKKNLVEIQFLNQKIKFQKKLGAAQRLEMVGTKLVYLSQIDNEAKIFLDPFLSQKKQLQGMTFSWRNIAGTQRLSNHSFGTAIDLLSSHGAQYWLWDEKKKNPQKAALGESAYRFDHYIPEKRPYIPDKI
ncbi:MAG: hypothetical protein HUU56_13635, partial [Bdellovibrionaceae bacterium]|nr:hypothetical protein [Pseudobdellovibrionaceae bacterium]